MSYHTNISNIRTHLEARYKGLPETDLNEVELGAVFLSQFALPCYGQVTPPSDAVAKVLGRRYYEPAEAARYKVGMTGRLNGSRDYARYEGDYFKLGCYSPGRVNRSEGRTAPVERYQAVTLEADAWLNGQTFTTADAAASEERSLQAIEALREMYEIVGCGDIINLVMHSGGKSVHAHLVTTGTTDEYTHKKLVGFVKTTAAIMFASNGLDLDHAPLNPSQAVRIPVGKVLGRDQRIIKFDPTRLASRSTEDYLAVFEAPTPAFTAALQRQAVLARENIQAALQAIPEGLTSGKRRSIEQRLNTLLLTIAEVLGETAAKLPRKERARKRAEGMNDTQRPPRVNLETGRVVFAEPIYGNLTLTRIKKSDGSRVASSIAEAATALWRDSINTGEQKRISVTEPGCPDDRAKSFMYHDVYRGHALYNDPSGTEISPALPPIGNTLIDAWGRFEWGTFDAATFAPAADVNVVMAQAGTGKTTAARRLISKLFMANQSARAVVCAPNVALGKQLVSLLKKDRQTQWSFKDQLSGKLSLSQVKVVHYKDATANKGKVELDEGTIYVCTMHDLKRLDPNSVDLFVFDELAAGLEMYNNPTKTGVWRGEDDARHVFAAMMKMVLGAKKTLLLEAVPTPSTMYFTNLLTKEVGEAGKTISYSRTEVQTGAGRVVDVMNENLIFGEALRCIKQGQRVMFQVAHRAQAQAFEAGIKRVVGKPVLLVTANAGNSEEVAKALTGDRMKEYAAVVATTGLAAGVSFVDVFDVVFFVCGTHLNAQTMAQGVHRDRTATRIVISRPVARDDSHRSVTDGAHAARQARMKTGDLFDKVHHAVMCDNYMSSVGFERLTAYLRNEGFTLRTGAETLEWVISDSGVPACKETRVQGKVRVGVRSQYDQAVHDYRKHCAAVKADVLQAASPVERRACLAVIQADDTRFLPETVKVMAELGLVGEHQIAEYLMHALPYGDDGLDKHYKQRLADADLSWRDSMRMLHGKNVDKTVRLNEWLACATILDDFFDMQVLQFPAKAAQVAKRFVDAETPVDRERYVLTAVKSARLRQFEADLKRATYNRRDPQADRLKALLGCITKRVSAQGLIAHALRVVYGVTVKVQESKRSGLTAITVDHGSAALMATVAAVALSYDPTTDTFGTGQLITSEQPRYDRERLARAARDLTSGSGVRKFLVKELTGETTWQAATSRVVPVSRAKARLKEGETPLYLSEVQTTTLAVEALPLSIPEDMPFFRYTVPYFSMEHGEIMHQRYTTKAAAVARWQQALNLTKQRKFNRNSSYAEVACKGQVQIGAPPPG